MDSAILTSNSDWDIWIRKIKLRALEQDVWQYVDPTKKRFELPKLESPNTPEFGHIGSLDRPEAKFRYELLVRDWNEKRDSYKAKKAALASLRTYIGQSIGFEHQYVLDGDMDPWKILVELQDKLKPADWEAQFRARDNWQKLLKGWNKRIKLDDWLNQWSATYKEVKRADLADYPEERLITEFFLTIRHIDPIFPRIVDSDNVTAPDL